MLVTERALARDAGCLTLIIVSCLNSDAGYQSLLLLAVLIRMPDA
jgi:hypothetical protein